MASFHNMHVNMHVSQSPLRNLALFQVFAYAQGLYLVHLGKLFALLMCL